MVLPPDSSIRKVQGRNGRRRASEKYAFSAPQYILGQRALGRVVHKVEVGTEQRAGQLHSDGLSPCRFSFCLSQTLPNVEPLQPTFSPSAQLVLSAPLSLSFSCCCLKDISVFFFFLRQCLTY